MRKKVKDLSYDEALKICRQNHYVLSNGEREFHCQECPLFETIKCVYSEEMKLEKEVEIPND